MSTRGVLCVYFTVYLLWSEVDGGREHPTLMERDVMHGEGTRKQLLSTRRKPTVGKEWCRAEDMVGAMG